MKTTDFVRDLRRRGVRLRLDGEDLRITAPRERLTPDLRDTVRERKDELVRYLRHRDGNGEPGADGRPPPLEPSREEALAPLSFAQERMWFFDRSEPGSTAYNRPYAFRIRGALDEDALRWSLRRIHRRHAALRTRFTTRDGEPAQEVLPDPEPALRVVEAPDGAVDGSDDHALLQEEARTPFDLARGPLARYLLVRVGPDEHAFVHNVHHSVSDGWSTGVLHRELERCYAARVEGREPELPELPVQYPDFARWQRLWLRGEALDRRLAYWKERLEENPDVLDLPLDRPRPPVQTYRGGRVTGRLGGSLADAVRALAREERATPFMVLFAAYAALLHRYSGQTDLSVGTPVAGRNRQELEDLIGLFINTVVLRADVGGDPSFRELVRRARRVGLEAMEHQEVPFEKVVEALRPERTASHHPLFQVLFTYHDGGSATLALPGLEVTPIPVDRGATYMDLDLTVVDGGDGMDLSLRYNSDLFDRRTAERLIEHYRILLSGAVDAPHRALSALPLLGRSERHRMVEEWNDTGAALGDPVPVHRMVEERAERTPDRTALVTADEEVSYLELVARTERLAGTLRGAGVEPGDLVAVATDRTAAMPVAVLAVWKAGAAYVPLDPSLPPERIRLMLDDSGARVVLADDAGAAALPEGARARRVAVDARGALAEEPDGRARSDVPAEAGAGPDDLAYVIYTSGSTGRPKGVEIEHRNAYNFLRSMAVRPGLEEDDVLLAVTTLSFDISLLELFLPLSVGARVVIADRETAADGYRMVDALRRHDVTALQATPATWRLLLEAGWEGEEPLRVLCGGEAMPPDLARDLTQRSTEVWNLYGPTETTVWSARYRVPHGGEPVRIGGPIENTRIYIVDGAGNPMPVGAAGELLIGGEGVARGYRDRPDLTAERFEPDPLAPEGASAARRYRTGDRARWRPDGTIEFLGRLDHQVKIRGFRIELGEIEATLADLDEVEEAAAAVREDRVDDKRLVAYVVFRDGRSLTASEIRSRLGERLPDYMVPSLVVEMDALPLNPSEKVDRNALPDPLAAGAAGTPAAAPPSTPSEELVADVWRDLLEVERIGRSDNFFDLGGHSLLSMRAVHRIEERTGRRLNPRTMILNTLEQIAAEVDREEPA